MADRRQPDHYSKRARKEGMAARSVYKLEEMDKRWSILRKGDRVLDLGCAPGSWTQYAARQVGESGFVLGIDLKAVNLSLPNSEVRVGDIYDLDDDSLGAPFNVVLSDMAPATIGDRKTDALRSAALAEAALAVAYRLLRGGGNVVVKVLEGGDVPQIVKDMRLAYRKVERLRPKATRKESTEIFLVGLGRNSPPIEVSEPGESVDQ